METLYRVATIFAILAGLGVVGFAQSSSPSCKPVERYGVKGCELLPDKTCPAGYHKQAVQPSNPQMMGPTFLMCVPDKPESEQKPKKQKPEPPPSGTQPT